MPRTAEGESVRLEFDTLVPLPSSGADEPDIEPLLGARRVTMYVRVQKAKGKRVQILFEAPRSVEIQRQREGKSQSLPR